MTPSPSQPSAWPAALLADAAGLLLFLAGRRGWTSAFSRPAADAPATQALLFGGAYLLFLVGIALLRRQASVTPAGAPQGRRLMGLALPLSLFLIVALGDVSGYFQAAATVDLTNPGGSYFLVTTPALYVALGLLYPLLLSQQPTPAGAASASLTWLGWLALNLFVIASAVYLNSLSQLWGLGPAGALLLLMAALALLFSLPRRLYLSGAARPAWASWALLVISLAWALAVGRGT